MSIFQDKHQIKSLSLILQKAKETIQLQQDEITELKNQIRDYEMIIQQQYSMIVKLKSKH